MLTIWLQSIMTAAVATKSAGKSELTPEFGA